MHPKRRNSRDEKSGNKNDVHSQKEKFANKSFSCSVNRSLLPLTNMQKRIITINVTTTYVYRSWLLSFLNENKIKQHSIVLLAWSWNALPCDTYYIVLVFLLGTWHFAWFINCGSMKMNSKLTRFNVNTFFFLQLHDYFIIAHLRVCSVHYYAHCKVWVCGMWDPNWVNIIFLYHSAIKLIIIIDNDYKHCDDNKYIMVNCSSHTHMSDKRQEPGKL